MYQPFLRDIGKTLGAGMQAQGLQQQKQQEQQLIQAAYMGQPGAMEQLVSVNPQVASQIQRDKTSQEQQKLQAQRYEEQQAKVSEQEKLKAEQALSKKIPELQEVVATVGDFDQAKKYYDQQISLNDTLIKTAGVPPERLEFTPEKYEEIKKIYAQKGKGDNQVQSSKILPGGVVVKVMKNGNVELYDPEKETRDIIEAAELRGAELAGVTTTEREEAKKSAKFSKENYDQLTKVRSNISNLEEGVKLLDEGASTGVIESKWPSMRASTIKLDNLRNRLGLDVISSVTFGALSEAEMDMAMQTALPKTLQPQELKKWLQDKIDAQNKLASFLEEAVIFTGKGGKISEFLESKKKEKAEKETPKKGETTASPSGAPKVGDVVGGYEFLGGDPSKQESWRIK